MLLPSLELKRRATLTDNYYICCAKGFKITNHVDHGIANNKKLRKAGSSE